MGLVKKNSLYVPDTPHGVCVWEVDGKYLSDGEGYLSLEGEMNDLRVERKMREAAYYWLGQEIGRPVWVPDARKVTHDEWEDQKARLIDGEVPDEVDAARQAMGRRK